MTSDQILQELQKRKLLAEGAAQKLKKEIFLSGRSAEELIHSQRSISDEKLAEIKSEYLRVPYQKVNFDALPADILEMIPEDVVRTYGVVPLTRSEDTLVVGMLNPDDGKGQEALKFIARRQGVNLGVYLINYGDWQEMLRKYSPYKSEIEAAVKVIKSASGSQPSRAIASLDVETGKGDEDAPIIKIVANTLREAVQSRASDVHVEPQERYLRIRFRVDGDLHEAASLPAELAQPIASRIKVISNLKIDETRTPQDGRFRARIFDREIDFRVATFPTPLGEKVAVRVLDSTTGLKSTDQIGLNPHNQKLLEEALAKPFGMILATGPTGSGKTTALYAILQRLNQEDVNIVSLEDPVEYFVAGVNQSQVRPEIGYDFASGLRQILRQDPDIIMVGEIRDNETAGLAVQAALTGHIVLSTLHTNNASGVIPRLLDMKVEPFLLPVSLTLMMSQRLVGVLCPDCKVAEVAPPAIQELIKKSLANLPADMAPNYPEPYQTYHAPGCPKCHNRGIVDRIAIHEMLSMTPGLEEVLNSGPTVQKILKEGRNQGMVTLRQDGVLKALAGITSIEEIIRNSDEV